MTIAEWVAVISCLVAIIALVFTIKNNKRTDTKDIEARVAENTKLSVKIDEAIRNTAEIKEEIKTYRQEVQLLGERMAKVEASASQAHKRIDRMEREGGNRE